jgi:hypothetical protein
VAMGSVECELLMVNDEWGENSIALLVIREGVDFFL